ncbi:MAG: hypothetical protein LRY66_15560 [Saccharospirillaceae bacterium]|nr:hypothetical protein [Saccharospirillaceae bacterium]MCD8532723.1 hypothetical protein [Saccharospirillaceae bacterium]
MRNLFIPFLTLGLLGCGPEAEDTDQPVSTTSSIVIYNKAFKAPLNNSVPASAY